MLNFYKPNANKTGHAIGLSFNSKEGKLHAQFVKQTSWDGNAHRGGFKGGDKFNLTFNATEIGAFLNCIERKISEKLFHQSAKGNTSIEVKPFNKKLAEDKTEPNGFTISVNPRANEGEDKPKTYGFWFDKKEERLLKEYLQFVLEHFFSAAYSADKKRRAEYAQTHGEKAEVQEAADPFAE